MQSEKYFSEISMEIGLENLQNSVGNKRILKLYCCCWKRMQEDKFQLEWVINTPNRSPKHSCFTWMQEKGKTMQ